MSTVPTIDAHAVAWSDGITDSGARLATLVLDALDRTPVVCVSVRGIRGIPSSYFNAFFVTAADRLTPEALADRVLWVFDSPTQEQVWRRSAMAFKVPLPHP